MFQKGKVAAVIFVNDNNEILLFLRDNKPSIPYPNTWALIGGHLEQGETPLEALKRETKEEINYELKNPIFLGLINDKAENVVYIYKSTINEKKENIKLNEGQRLDFFSFEDSLSLNIPYPLKEFLIRNQAKII